LYPSKGKGLKPSDEIYIANRGSRRRLRNSGTRWAIGPTASGRLRVRLCVFDTNHWKSFLMSRWRSSVGSPDALTLFGKDERTHHLFASHQIAEKATRLVVESTGIIFDQWQERLGGQGRWPNDWFDCCVGCCIAASIAGARLLTPEADQQQPRTRRKRSLESLRALGGAV
jgi:hypothetical protein